MLLSEWSIKTNTQVDSEVLYAGSLLEKYGFLFGRDFDAGSAVEKATKLIIECMDEEEDLLMEKKQSADENEVDEPRIQDRRTFSWLRKDIWDN